MKLSTELLNIIVCPISGEKLVYDQDKSLLISDKSKIAYPVIDGIPLLLKSEAIKLSKAQDAGLAESETRSEEHN